MDNTMIDAVKISRSGPAWVGHHRLPTGGPAPILYCFLRREKIPSLCPKVGLSSSSDYEAYYLAPQEERPSRIELVAGPVHDGACGFWEVDHQLMPGVYGLQVPSALRRRGYTFVYLHFADTQPYYLQHHGVEYNPYDAFALGLDTWFRSTCHEHLTSGLRKSMPATLRLLLIDWFNRDREEIQWKSF